MSRPRRIGSGGAWLELRVGRDAILCAGVERWRAAACVLLCACASRPVDAPTDAELPVVYEVPAAEAVDELRAAAADVEVNRNEDGVVCEREQKTGTHMRRIVCRTENERASMRQSSQEWLRSGGLEGGPVVTR